MDQIDAILDFAEREMPAHFSRNKPDYANKQDKNLKDLKRCQVYKRFAQRIKAGEKTNWVPSPAAVWELLQEFAPGVYTCEITATFNRV